MHKFLFYNKFIIFRYMFQALLCLSSGGHSVGGRPVRNPSTGRPPTDFDDTRYCIIQFWPLDDKHNSARNM